MGHKTKLKIALLEPFFSGSHKQWAVGLKAYSQYDIDFYTMTGKNWKWRLQASAIELAKDFNNKNISYDLIIATSLMDLTVFQALTRKLTSTTPFIYYFHENQLAYPWSPHTQKTHEQNKLSLKLINLKSAYAADKVFTNSKYQKNTLLEEGLVFLNTARDYPVTYMIDEIRMKTEVLYLGLELKRFDSFKVPSKSQIPIILWNHRWEYDKNPKLFSDIILRLHDEGYDFKLNIIGETVNQTPKPFELLKEKMPEKILNFGYAASFEDYAKAVCESHIAFTTSNHDFFGASVVEAIYCGCYPLLPNRLAYPEHIDSDDYFYNTEKDAYEILKGILEKKKHLDFTPIDLSHYDWNQCIGKYDQSLGQVLAQFENIN
ncbi:MAG: glycosyltransferase involved in cell wall biosynthesis [Thermoproteota archaeon]|jgi:glycosyltransferase involved in cell wall biosynthesis